MIPNLTKQDVERIIPNVTEIGNPLKGGQKIVFPAKINGNPCVIKFMLITSPPGVNGDEVNIEDFADEVTERAKREVETMLQCNSDYIVKTGPLPLVYNLYSNQHLIYFTEELIDGEDVARMLSKQGQLAIQELICLCGNISEAVKVLWSLEKIHRDIKPQNIMHRNSNKTFILLDMGLTFDLLDSSLTASGVVPGTYAYFSPEQMDLSRKRQMDFRSDLFSLGIVLYQAATGIHPFNDSLSRDQTLINIRNLNPDPPISIRRDLPQELNSIIMRLLAKKPHLRYNTCEEILLGLSQF